jgi:hypothetical protein
MSKDRMPSSMSDDDDVGWALAPLPVLEASRQGIVPVEIGQRPEIRLVDHAVAGIAARRHGWWPLRGLSFLAEESVQKAHVDSSSKVL